MTYIGMYRNPPSASPTAGVWIDGTALDYLNWYPGQPDNTAGQEVCVAMFASTIYNCHNSIPYA